MEDVCITIIIIVKRSIVSNAFSLFLCNCYNRVGLPGWELKMQSTGESKEMLASLKGDDTYTAPKTTA